MKVVLLVSRAGVDFTEDAGDEVDVSDAEAKRMIAAGQAQPLRAQKRETTTRKVKAEKAAK